MANTMLIELQILGGIIGLVAGIGLVLLIDFIIHGKDNRR